MYETLGYKQKLEKEYDFKVFTNNVDFPCLQQTEELLKQEAFKNTKVRLMPDTHAGKGAVIGFTAKMNDKIIPNIVGSDIGCGMLLVKLTKIKLDLENLDKEIKKDIPLGAMMYDKPVTHFKDLDKILFFNPTKMFLNTVGTTKGSAGIIADKFELQIGTLGGGNHFIEIDEDEQGDRYLVIHTGSRNLGKTVSEYYQNLAVEYQSGIHDYIEERKRLVEEYKSQGRQKEIQKALKELEDEYKNSNPKIPKDLCYLEETLKDFYLHDMEICQKYAILNREIIAKRIINCINRVMGYNLDFDKCGHYHTIHNYIDFDDMVIRKGAINAEKGKEILIPMNMRDGSLICIGKGNPDWNNSAPHGAGRIMSRGKAKLELSLEDYENSMEGVYSSTVNMHTIDEAPMVYKPMKEIMENIKDSVEIIKVIKPIYNLKAGIEEEYLYNM